jgi:hypothetical protein
MQKKTTLFLLLIACCLLPNLLRGQNLVPFAPIGSKWVYNFFSYGHGSGYIKMSFTKDTSIEGISCRELKFDVFFTYCDPATGCGNSTQYEYFFQRNDSLFKITPTQIPKIKLVFDYRCRVGDTLSLTHHLTYNPNIDPISYPAKILRKGDTTLNGRRLKFWELGEYCRGRLIPNKFFHFEQALNPTLFLYSAATSSSCSGNAHFVQELCSFESSGWTYFAKNCRNATQEIAASLQISPNPTIENLQITSPQYFSANYHIYDAQGRVVQNGLYTEGSKLNVSELASGLYFLALQNKDGRSIRKFIKY